MYEKMAHLKLMNIYLYKRMLNVQRIVLLLLYVTFTVPSLAEVATMQLPQLSLNLNNVTRREVFNTIEKIPNTYLSIRTSYLQN